jgi:hypothetical protein
MACVNQTRPHCVNQMGKSQSKPLAAWHGNGMACVNQTQPHCVNQMGKSQSKPLVARHGMCELAFRAHCFVHLILAQGFCVLKPNPWSCNYIQQFLQVSALTLWPLLTVLNIMSERKMQLFVYF